MSLNHDLARCKQYGRLSIMAQYFCETEYLFTVPPEAFSPPPKVESAVIRLIPKKQHVLSEKEFSAFERIVKSAFQYRRNNLAPIAVASACACLAT